jgi:hypothetical protein
MSTTRLPECIAVAGLMIVPVTATVLDLALERGVAGRVAAPVVEAPAPAPRAAALAARAATAAPRQRPRSAAPAADAGTSDARTSDAGSARSAPEPETDLDDLVDPAAARARALAALAEGRYEIAVDEGTWCLANDALAVECVRAVRWALIGTGAWEDVEGLVSSCLEAEPANADCLAAMVAVSLHDDDVDGAEALVEQLRGLDDVGSLAFAEANIQEHRGALSEASEGYAASCRNGQAYACARARIE